MAVRRDSALPQPDPSAWEQFCQQVYAIVRRIPPGRVTTYGRIAGLIAPPSGMEPANYLRIAPRWVGYALRSAADDLPWQRVLNSRGGSSPRLGESDELQRHLLESEGVIFNNQNRVDLQRYLWKSEG